ncbi:5-formyltetrahydrofolate cyclo-ligase [Amycolatopsis pithecellobii]|uniref:5-formyltetrahydrofolate cyclo-ligase n=1 Tax=Amycolatopsis pithecellobii TaxID=664692 RepID=A0A6N7YZH2_9PSEU|nr:5-formyltetrahydrofolate cyclo-ligase [Amycolatopsis pithecellobii]MTD57312.1 5-formyltetrahydrofolate cyclo-ligase [Amycolatopsis pithecellobii]
MGDGRNGELGKTEWRARLKAARRDLSQAERVSEASALVNSVASMSLPDTVCCYVPFGTEPGSFAWLDVIRSTGARVLLPVIPAGAAALDWAEYTGPQTLSPGRVRGILEPSGPRLGPAALRDAGLVLVPALAVDRSGARLGRGAGHYDRSLVHAADDAALIAVVRDTELVERLPAEAHDIRMTGALTPRQGLVPLPIP